MITWLVRSGQSCRLQSSFYKSHKPNMEGYYWLILTDLSQLPDDTISLHQSQQYRQTEGGEGGIWNKTGYLMWCDGSNQFARLDWHLDKAVVGWHQHSSDKDRLVRIVIVYVPFRHPPIWLRPCLALIECVSHWVFLMSVTSVQCRYDLSHFKTLN